MAYSIARHALQASKCVFRRSFTNVLLHNSPQVAVVPCLKCNIGKRNFSLSPRSMQDEDQAEDVEEENVASAQLRPVHDVETSMRYIESKAYDITYGNEPVWVPYRRNHKGAIPPQKTRKSCIYKGKITTGNPCPICRDEYLVLHPKNLKLLNQFISPYNGEVIPYKKTGVCLKQHKNLQIAVEQAWDIGYIDKPIPFKEFDYADYYPQLKS